MFFTERFLKREIQISRIASELKPFYLKKLKVLEDGLKNKKITRLNWLDLFYFIFIIIRASFATE